MHIYIYTYIYYIYRYNTCAYACASTYVFKSGACQVTAQLIHPSMFCIPFEGRTCFSLQRCSGSKISKKKRWEGLEDWRMNGRWEGLSVKGCRGWLESLYQRMDPQQPACPKTKRSRGTKSWLAFFVATSVGPYVHYMSVCMGRLKTKQPNILWLIIIFCIQLLHARILYTYVCMHIHR